MRSTTSPSAPLESSCNSLFMRSKRCVAFWPSTVRRLISSWLHLPSQAARRCRRSLIFLFRFSSSVWRGANWDCSSDCACLPSAVVPMAPRMLITPTLLGAADPAAGDCARTSTAPAIPATARAAAGNIILEFTVFSLLWIVSEKPERPEPSHTGLKIVALPPAGPEGVLQTRKYSRDASFLAIGKRVAFVSSSDNPWPRDGEHLRLLSLAWGRAEHGYAPDR